LEEEEEEGQGGRERQKERNISRIKREKERTGGQWEGGREGGEMSKLKHLETNFCCCCCCRFESKPGTSLEIQTGDRTRGGAQRLHRNS